MGRWGEEQIDGTEEGQRREGSKEGGDEGRCDAGFGLYERFKNETFYKSFNKTLATICDWYDGHFFKECGQKTSLCIGNDYFRGHVPEK